MEWLSSLVLAWLCFAGEIITLLADRALGILPLFDWMRFAHAVLAIVMIGVLLKFRRLSSRALTVSSFLALFLPLFPLSYFYHSENLRLLTPGIVFMGQKLFFLALSILVPGPYWINIALMAGFALQTIWLYVGDGPNLHAFFVQSAEPWATILYALVGGTLLAFRYHYQQITRQLTVSQAQTELFEDIARVFLSIRDLANTPLQSLGIAAELLDRNYPNAGEITERLSNSVRKLNSLNQIFKVYEKQISWGKVKLMTEEEIRVCLEKMSIPPPTKEKG